MPLFRGHTGLLAKALGGWQLNASVVYQSGQPVSAPSGAFSTGIDPNVSNQNHLSWFNSCYINLAGARTNYASDSTPAAWIQQPSFTLNTLSQYLPNIRTRRPPVADVSLFKMFPIYDRVKFQIRTGAFSQTVLASGGFASTSNDPRSVQLSARINVLTLARDSAGRSLTVAARIRASDREAAFGWRIGTPAESRRQPGLAAPQ